MSDFRVGEIVDVAIKGARIEGDEGRILIVDVAPEDPSAIPVELPLGDNVTVERSGLESGPEAYVSDDGDGCLWLRCGRCQRHLVVVEGGTSLAEMTKAAAECACSSRVVADGEVSEP